MLRELLKLTRPLIIFDLETTGTDPETARICQIAFRMHKPEGEPVFYKTLVDPLVEIPAEASKVHGITDDIIRFGCAKCRHRAEEHPLHDERDDVECPEFKPVPQLRQLGPRIASGFAGCDLAGYRVHFDIDVLGRQLLRECNIQLEVDDVAIVDPARLWQVLEPRTLSDGYERYTGKKAEGAHDAFADVTMTEEMLIGQLQENPDTPRDVRALHDLLWPDRIDYEGKFVFNKHGEPCFGFGKNKGKPMRSDIGYLRWMSRQGNWSSAVTRIVDAALEGRFPERKVQA